MRRLRGLSLGLALLASLAPAAVAQRLGRIDFPTSSGNRSATLQFLTGVLYLHSFEYSSALQSFREAERLDPGYAMAYWGEAMTYTHPVWNEQDLAAARAALVRLGPTPAVREARAPTEREKGYLRAVEALYGEGTKPARDTAYAVRMEALAAAHPTDDEAQLFYSLALLGLSQGARDVPTYMRAGAIAIPIFEKNREHPGAAHYVIHAFDDPVHAVLGLSAARAYGAIAPDAAHAQHMTSHIFLALGLWDDVVQANESAVAVVERGAKAAGRTPRSCGHYPEWLLYGYLQQGRIDRATTVLAQCQAHPVPEGSADDIEAYAGMRAAFLVDSREPGPFLDEPAGRDPGTRAYLAFGTGFVAAMRGDRSGLASALARLQRAVGEMPGSDNASERILALELGGLGRAAAGDSAAALALVTEAARVDDSLPIPFGPPVSVKPPHELAGDLLAARGRWTEARAAYAAALARTPRRPAALQGLARAEAGLGRTAEAEAILRTLARIRK